jgi:hypothetical protein
MRLRFTRRAGSRTVAVGSSPTVAVRAGRRVVRIPARGCRMVRGRWTCRALRPGGYLATIQARSAPSDRWQRLGRIAVRIVRQG